MNEFYSFNFQPVQPQPAATSVTSSMAAGSDRQSSAGAPNHAPLAYTVEEAASALHVSPKTIRRLLTRGVLTASKALRKKLIPRFQIEGFLKATCDQPKTLR